MNLGYLYGDHYEYLSFDKFSQFNRRKAIMSDSKTYNGITQDVFNCVRTTSIQQDKTVYTPPDANQGTTMTEGKKGPLIWHVKMSFNFTPANGQLAYTILDKSSFIPEDDIWNGISKMISGCQSQ
jgi:hypothetical protein